MKIKSSYILLACVVGPLLLSGNAIQSNQASMAPTADFVRSEAAARRDEQARATQALRDSQVALERVKGRCTVTNPAIAVTPENAAQYPGARKATNGEYLVIEASSVLSEGGRAIDDATGLAMTDGFICTSGRSTAEVIGGQVTQVRNAAAEDFEEYDQYLDKQRG